MSFGDRGFPCDSCAVGYLLYAGEEHEFEDRLLAHLKVAMGLKFRKQESFFLSWNLNLVNRSGRISVWMSPSQQIGFRFSGGKPAALNKEWVRVLVELSGSPRGMIAMTERDAVGYAASDGRSLAGV